MIVLSLNTRTIPNDAAIKNIQDNLVIEVILECKSLDLLNEGVKIVSKAKLCLINGVSVIDSWPLFVKEAHPKVKEDEWDQLYDLVVLAIQNKKPNLLLCMGPDFWHYHTQMISSIHPRRLINHNSTDSEIR
jgi:hypothetical protein